MINKNIEKTVEKIEEKRVVDAPKTALMRKSLNNMADKYVKRFNMAFLKELEEYLRKTAIREGKRITSLVNEMLSECQNHEIVICDDIKVNTTQGFKGARNKRINIYFSEENYDWITEESQNRGMKKTEFTNQVLLAEMRRRQSY